MIGNEDERRKFYEGASVAPESVIRDWALTVAATWEALDPRDPTVAPSDTRSQQSYGAARALINDFCIRQAFDAPQSPEALRWLAEALQRILDHKDPLHSLGLLPRPKQRPADPQAMLNVVFWMWCASELGYGHAEVKSLAAERFNKDTKTIERYFAKGAPQLEWMNPDVGHWVRYFLARGRPLPPPKDRK